MGQDLRLVRLIQAHRFVADQGVAKDHDHDRMSVGHGVRGTFLNDRVVFKTVRGGGYRQPTRKEVVGGGILIMTCKILASPCTPR